MIEYIRKTCTYIFIEYVHLCTFTYSAARRRGAAMKLSVLAISELLRMEKIANHTVVKCNPGQSLSGVRMMGGKSAADIRNADTWHPDAVYLYVGNDGLYTRREEQDDLPAPAGDGSCAEVLCRVIVPDEKKDPIRLFTLLQGIFERFQIWEERTKQAILEERDLQEVFNLCSMVTRDTVYLTDTSMRMLVHTDPTMMQEVSAIWRYQAKYGYMPVNIVNALVETGELRRICHQKKAFTLKTKVFNLPYTCRNFWIDGELKAHLFIVAIYSAPLQIHQEIADAMAGWLMPMVKKNPFFSAGCGSFFESFFQDLAHGKITDENWIRQQIDMFGWKLDDIYAAVVLLSSDDGQQNLQFAIKYISDLSDDSKAFRDGEYGAVVLRVPSVTALQGFLEKLNALLHRMHLTAAVSNQFRGIKNYSVYLKQAKRVLRFGRKTAKDTILYRQANLGFYSILEASLENHNVYELCHPDILSLHALDQKQGTIYLETLYQYLLNGCNAVKAAKSMYMHRNTMNNHLKKIEERLTCSLEDPETCLYLLVSIRLIRMQTE